MADKYGYTIDVLVSAESETEADAVIASLTASMPKKVISMQISDGPNEVEDLPEEDDEEAAGV